MTAQIISGKKISKEIKAELKKPAKNVESAMEACEQVGEPELLPLSSTISL